MELFERDDWRLFTSYTTLPQKAGVSKDDLDRVMLKELMDNALDAGTGVNMIEDFDGFVSISNRGKVVPTEEVLQSTYVETQEALVRSKLLESVLSEVGFEEMVANAVNELGSAGDLSELVDNVRKGLTDNMEAHWSRVVHDIASDRL